MQRKGVWLCVAVPVFLLTWPSFVVGQQPAGSEARFVKNARALTYQGRRAGEGYFSPDGKYLVFQDEREKDNPFYQIYILNLESGETRRVSPGMNLGTGTHTSTRGRFVFEGCSNMDPLPAMSGYMEACALGDFIALGIRLSDSGLGD